MKKEVGQLVKHSAIYGTGSILSKCVSFLMIPFYTTYPITSDYGVLEMLDLTLFLSGIFGMMGVNSAFFRFFAAADSEEEKKEVTSTAWTTLAGLSLLVVGLIELLAGEISEAAFGNAGYTPLIRIVAFTLFFSNLTEVPLAYIRVRKRTVLFTAITLGRTLLGAGLLILALAVLHKGVLGVVYANLVSNVLTGVALLSVLMPRVWSRVSRKKFEEMFRYGAPMVVQTLASFVLIYSDRFFLRHFASLSAVGIYGLGYKLAAIVSLLVSAPFGMTWAWQQFDLAKKDDGKEMCARIQLYQLTLLVFIGLAIALLGRDFLRITTPAAYWNAAQVVPLIVLSYVLLGMRAVIWTGILVRRVTHHVAWISVVAAASNLLFNYLLIPRYSYMGAAVATVLSFTINLILGYVIAQRAYFVRYDYIRNSIILGSATAVYLASTLVELQLAASIAVNVLLILIFGVLSIAMLRREERAMFWQLGATAVERIRKLRPQYES